MTRRRAVAALLLAFGLAVVVSVAGAPVASAKVVWL